MFLYMGATPVTSNIFLTLTEIALTSILTELVKEFISITYHSKELMIMFCFIPAILLGTAEGLR